MVFCGSPISESMCSSSSFLCSWDSLPPVGLPCPARYEGFCLVFLYIVLYLFVFCKPALFRRGNEVGVDKREREYGGGLEEWREGKLGLGILYDGIIYYQLKNSNTNKILP